MNQSFYTAVTGSKSFQTAIDVTGNNIAHVNTTGYKSATTDFAALFAEKMTTNDHITSSDASFGSKTSTALNLEEGSLQTTDNTFDMAIRGDGWFGVANNNIINANDIAFTRNGVFSVDKNYNLVNSSGNYLLGTNYSNIIKTGDGYEIDPSVQATDPTVTTQSPLFVPDILTYPPTASTGVTIQSNLNDDKVFFTPARPDTAFSAVFSDNREFTDLRDGQDMILQTGDGNFWIDNGSINQKISFSDKMSGNVSFKLNGEQISLSIPEGTDAKTIAQTFYNELTDKGIEDLYFSIKDNTLFIRGDDTISITDTVSPSFIQNSSGKLLVYSEKGTASNNYSTLSDFTKLVKDHLNTIYPDTAQVSITDEGKISIYATGDMELEFAKGENSNDFLLSAVGSLTRNYEKDTTASGFALQRMEKKILGSVIAPDGTTKEVTLNMVLTDNKNNYNGNSWDISADITSDEPLDKTIDMANVLYGGDRVNLINGEEVWVKAGLADTIFQNNKHNYLLKIAGDYSDGQSASISFNLDGEDYSFSFPDGESRRNISFTITSALQDAGYSVSNNDDDSIVIAPKEDSLVMKDGDSSVIGLNVYDMAIKQVVYDEKGEKGFKTAGDFLSDINNTLASLSMELSIVDGKLTLDNNSSNQSFFSFTGGANSNEDLMSTLYSLSGSVAGNSTLNGSAMEGAKTYDATSRLYEFSETGNLSEIENLTLDNGGETLTIDLSGIISTVAQTPIVDGFSQNGTIAGNYNGYSVGTDGSINVSFTNGKTVAVSKTSVFHFQNDQGLEKIGDNLFVESQNSGDPFFYVDEEGNYFETSTVLGKTLENSNVETSIALTELIVFQRSFGGAAKAITTSDQMIQNAINLKR